MRAYGGRGVNNSGQEAVVIRPGGSAAGALAASQGHSGRWGAGSSVRTSREWVGEGWGHLSPWAPSSAISPTPVQ